MTGCDLLPRFHPQGTEKGPVPRRTTALLTLYLLPNIKCLGAELSICADIGGAEVTLPAHYDRAFLERRLPEHVQTERLGAGSLTDTVLRGAPIPVFIALFLPGLY